MNLKKYEIINVFPKSHVNYNYSYKITHILESGSREFL